MKISIFRRAQNVITSFPSSSKLNEIDSRENMKIYPIYIQFSVRFFERLIVKFTLFQNRFPAPPSRLHNFFSSSSFEIILIPTKQRVGRVVWAVFSSSMFSYISGFNRWSNLEKSSAQVEISEIMFAPPHLATMKRRWRFLHSMVQRNSSG